MSRMLGMSSSGRDEGLQRLDGQVGHVAAGDHHVAHARACGAGSRGSARSAPGLRDLEAVLLHLGHVVAHQVHAGAVAAVLRAGGEHLRQHLGRVAVGQALDRPHVGLVQAVAGRRAGGSASRVRGRRRRAACSGAPGRAQRSASSMVLSICGGIRIDIVARSRWSRSMPAEQVVGKQVAETGLQLLEVLHRVLALPEGGLPLGLGDVPVAGEPAPVRLGRTRAGAGR